MFIKGTDSTWCSAVVAASSVGKPVNHSEGGCSSSKRGTGEGLVGLEGVRGILGRAPKISDIAGDKFEDRCHQM